MTIDRARLSLALEQLTAENWSDFENYASAFFATEFPNLRTMASPSGDDGRDGEIFSPDGLPNVALQYSVTPKWAEKVRHTVKRLKETDRHPTLLIYGTNQQIGALGDSLKARIITEEGIVLDIRDRSYFLDRYQQDQAREQISTELARKFVDPLLERKGIIQRKASALSPGENRAALVFLELQWEDDTRDKGLTKTAFEALVRSVLRDTDSDHRMDLASIFKAVQELLPAHTAEYITREVEKALRRLDKSVIKSREKDLTYCLSHEEKQRIDQRLVELQLNDNALTAEISEVIRLNILPDSLLAGKLELAQQAARATIDRYFLERGEQFVIAVESGNLAISSEIIKKISKDELKKGFGNDVAAAADVDALTRVVEQLLGGPSDHVANYLRGLSDAYTLRAFLRRTTDVQEAVRKMFSIGEIWMDTSIMLPLFAEGILPRKDQAFRKLIASAKDAGLSLRVTSGVIEELERHMNRARVCANALPNTWQGTIPYLLALYVTIGRDVRLFDSWLNLFRGENRPLDDLGDYVRENFGIHVTDIEPDAMRANQELRTEVLQAWQDIHLARRSSLRDGQEVSLRMASHDADNYLGVIQRRHSHGEGALGYTSWWLTLDQKAFSLIEKLSKHLLGRSQSPVMSADFLANYLAVGPLRDKVAGLNAIPLALDATILVSMNSELFELARQIRTENEGQPEYVIQRKVRDGIDEAKRRTGELHARGLNIEPFIEGDLI